MNSVMDEDTQRELLAERLEGFERFAEWERSHPLRPDPRAAIAGISRLYNLLPDSSRSRPVDPTGIVEMRRCLSVLRFEAQ